MKNPTYTSLNDNHRQFRIVTLLPGLPESPVECTLKVDRFNSTELQYEALSYEWGDANGEHHTITLNQKPFAVRNNLYHALRALRRPWEARVLWVDAICINQSDILERNHQVGLMGDIYRRASNVLIWLGNDAAECEEAFRLLPEIWDSFEEVSRMSDKVYEEAERLKEIMAEERGEEYVKVAVVSGNGHAERGDGLLASNIQSWDGNHAPAPTRGPIAGNDILGIVQGGRVQAWVRSLASSFKLDTRWGDLAALLERTYWRRIWIVQEYVLASSTTILCGKFSVDGNVFDDALRRVTEIVEAANNTSKARFPGEMQDYLDRIRNSAGMRISERRIFKSARPLLQLIEACRSSQSCDPRDRIYAILGLASDIPPNAILVDYNRSIPKVKMDVAWFFHTRLGAKREQVSFVCSLLDEIFADCDEGDD